MWPCEADTQMVAKLNSNHHKAYWQTFIRPLLKFWCWNMCRGLEAMDLIGKQQIFLYMYKMEETLRWRHRVLFWIVIKMKLILPFAMLLISVASLELNFGELPNKGRYDKTGRVLRPLGAAAFNIQELAKDCNLGRVIPASKLCLTFWKFGFSVSCNASRWYR